MTDTKPPALARHHGHQLAFLQYARAVGALLVILLHLAAIERKYTAHSLLAPLAWERPFLIFFAVSGFVLAYAYGEAREFRAGGFLLRRLWRIYPVYWQFTLLVLPVYLLRPEMVNSAFAKPDIALSFLMLPQEGMPLLAVGWTMVYELFFYFLFVAGMMALRGRVVLFCALWAGALLAGNALASQKGPWLTVLLSGLNGYFIMGMLAGVAYRRLGKRRDLPSFRPLLAIGNATYSIYLSHVLVASLCGRVWMALAAHFPLLATLPLHMAFLLGTALLCLALGWLNYRYVEAPLTEWGKKRLARHAPMNNAGRVTQAASR